jgi:hypothetical protein
MASSRVSFIEVMVSMTMARSSSEKSGNSRSPILLDQMPIPLTMVSALVRFRAAWVVASAVSLAAAFSCPARFPGFRYQFQPARGAATMGESECVSGERVNASDFRMILAEDNTEKSRG